MVADLNANTSIIVREFTPADAQDFEFLNAEWITRFFVLEPKDLKALQHPQETIIDQGGRIFLAYEGDVALGCCALLPMGANEYEIAKMAVTERAQGRGVGFAVLQHTIDAARVLGATRLYLETNHTLGSAIHLYRKAGFRDVPAERRIPSPYARADVFMEMFF